MTAQTELLLMADGRVLVHNLTPAMSQLLGELGLQEWRQTEAKPGPAPDALIALKP